MKRTYVNRLPKNEEVKNTNVRIENGELVVEVEFEDKFEPKDGDFCVTENGCIFIYNSNYKLRSDYILGYYVGIDCYNDITINEDDRFGFPNEVRCATQQEKTVFLERLEKECHKRWNSEKKCLEDVRWRAEVGETFYHIDGNFCINSMVRCEFHSFSKMYDSLEEQLEDERMSNIEYMLWEKGNYFKNREAAQKVADQIKEIFKNSKAE